MGKFEHALLVSTLMAASFLVLIGGAADMVEGGEPTRGGIDDPFEGTVYFQDLSGPYYPGQHERLYIAIYSSYDGSGFGGSASPGNETMVKEVKVSYMGLYYEEDGTPAPSQTNLGETSFYNNDGDGYDIARYNTEYFYADPSNNYLELDVKTTDFQPGDYVMRFQVSFRYMVDWDGATQYDWTTTIVTFDRIFELRSYIGGENWPDYRFRAFDENHNPEDLYSGARNERFGIRYISSRGGTLTDIQATLSFPGIPVVIRDPVQYYENIVSMLVWNIDVPMDLPAGTYTVQMQLEYSRNGVPISEVPMSYEFEVEFTPLIMPPEFNDLSSPFETYMRNNLPTTLEVPFTNMGNIDLHDVVVSLDTSNTRYVKNGMYWFNENSNANVVFDDLEVSIENIPVGESRMATFDMVNFLPRLPPGLYKIPIDYYGIYYDDGSTGNAPGEKVSGYWDEMGYYHHRNILQEIEYPETNDDHVPYLLIRIMDDPEGPEITGFIDSGENPTPGTVNRRMRLRVENHEMYQFYNLEYRIHIDDGSPFNHPYAHNNYTGTTLPPVYRAGLSESSGTSTNSDYFYFYANIREDAMPGINFFKVDVKGVNEWSEPFNQTFIAYITINTHQPKFQEINIEVGDILDDRSVEVTVELQNFGMGGARNLSAYFDYSSSGYFSMDGPAFIGDIGHGDTFFYTFHFKPDGSRRYLDGSYSGTIYFSYYDDLDHFVALYSGVNMNLRFDIYEKLPDIRIIDVDAPLVDRDKEFTVRVTIMNFGGSTAEDLSILLPYDSNQFRILEGGEQDIGDLEAGDASVLEFRMKAQDEISDGTTYTFYIYFSYTDIQGRTRTFGEGPNDGFSIRIKDRIIPSQTQTVVKDDGVWISDGAGNFLLGIMILIAVIVFVKLSRGKTEVVVKKTSKGPDTSKRSKELDMEKKRKVEFDEDEDEEEEDEEEDEEEEEEEDEDEAWK